MSDLVLANSVWQRFQGVSKMKLEIARSLFFVAALGVTAVAVAAWQQPGPRILAAHACSTGACPSTPVRKQVQLDIKPDANLLLLMFGLKTALKGEQ